MIILYPMIMIEMMIIIIILIILIIMIMIVIEVITTSTDYFIHPSARPYDISELAKRHQSLLGALV